MRRKKREKNPFLCQLTGVQPLSPPPSEAFGSCCHLDALRHREDPAFTDTPPTGENRSPLLLKDAWREPTGGAEIGSAPIGTGTSAIDRARAAPPRRWVRRFLAGRGFCTCDTSCISACSCDHCVFSLSSSTWPLTVPQYKRRANMERRRLERQRTSQSGTCGA